ncbi:hypothetical protein F5B22DRAFT_324277 [Xylaria bambusicola]|uniref:uncharacterized protein n=1 Tax=Xylaria bambusicola TaxID=326684 RepID=UPI002008499C|nr:uncharacterized protein F5B22DRAFT_324277 [Xylaria bambusicola]KAI0509516.1 hypothetical protein F5B22DRAFT_324277 [Xylaria bambusicola]
MHAIGLPLLMTAYVVADTLISNETYNPPNIPPHWPPNKPPPPPSQEHVAIAVETLHHRRGHTTSLTNQTIEVPVGPVYRNGSALGRVSTLYLLDNTAVTCIPYLSEKPTGPHGNPFTVGHPAVLSEDTPVTVGNILCTHAGQ